MDGLNVRYWAGMIWSVSMLSPSTYALPRMAFIAMASNAPLRTRDREAGVSRVQRQDQMIGVVVETRLKVRPDVSQGEMNMVHVLTADAALLAMKFEAG